MSGRLSLEEVLQLVQDGEDPPDDVSDDDEDLVGDFVSASGRPMLFSDALRDNDGDDQEFMCPDTSEPCFRSSLLLLDQSLAEVKYLRKGKHFATTATTRGRCAVCGNKKKPSGKRRDTKITNYCTKCKKYLCKVPCFEKYHTKYRL